MRRHLLTAVFAAGLVAGLLPGGLAARPALAQAPESERDVLRRLDNELGVLERLVYQAEQQAQRGDRVFFDYRALRADIAGMRVGVQSYIADARPQPRVLPPLQQQYVRSGGGR